jgi:Putative phage tail protein
MAQLVVMAVVAAIEVSMTIYRLLNQPGVKSPAPMRDQFSTSAAGSPIIFGYGKDREPGQVIWTTGVKYTTQKQGGKGGPTVTSYTYFASFAVSFCEGPARIRRVWFDSKIVYDPTPGSSASYNPEFYPLWTNSETYNIGSTVSWAGQVWRAIGVSTGAIPGDIGSGSVWEQLSDYPLWQGGFVSYNAGDVVSYGGELYVALQTSSGVQPSSNSADWKTLKNYYPAPTIYPGDELQLPDPLIQASEGAARTPAFRGQCYAVWENFPLANFGNRIPNFRAELIFGDVNGPEIQQQGYVQNLEPSSPPVVLTQPVAAGDFLIAMARWRNVAGGSPTISDDAGNTWTTVWSANNKGIWFCDAALASSTLKVQPNFTGSYFAYDADVRVVHISGQTSYTYGSANGTTDPMVVTDGAYSISLTFQSPGSTADWAAALFVLQDATGHVLQIAVFLSDDGFGVSAANDGTRGIPLGYSALPPGSANGASQILYTGLPTSVLASVVLNLCQRAGLDSGDVDVSLLNSINIVPTDVVAGYSVRQAKQAVDVIRVLMAAYFFDGCESDVVKFIPRGLGSVITIPESDLGLLQDKSKLNPEQIAQEQDLPQLLTLTYRNPGKNYEPGKQQKSRSTRIVATRNQKQVDLDLVLTDPQAATIAEKLLWIFWLEQDSHAFKLWQPKYLVLEPCDIIQFVYSGITFEDRLVEANAGQGFALDLKAMSDGSFAYESTAKAGIGESVFSGAPEVQAPTLLFLLDIPLMRDGDANPGGTGFSFGMGSAIRGWPGAVLDRSPDDATFSQIDKSNLPVTFGRANNQLGVPAAPWVLDSTNTLTVKLAFGTLESATDDEIAAGANALLIGNNANGFELLQFKTATLIAEGTYTLSDLYRGLRGTEWVCGFWGDFSNGTNRHNIGDVVLDPYSGVLRHQDNLSTVGLLWYYRAVSNGQDLPSVGSQQFTNTGNDLRPYAPKNVGGFVDAANNWVITWTRRSRFGGADGSSTSPLPLGEDKELYEVEILNGSTVVRTISNLTTTTAIYTLAQQTADFGSHPASFSVNVYQISAQIGRGFKGHGPVPGGTSPEVLPKIDFGFYINGA